MEGYYIAAGSAGRLGGDRDRHRRPDEDFPATRGATRLVAAISIVLVAATIGLAIYLSATEEHEKGGAEHAALDRI